MVVTTSAFNFLGGEVAEVTISGVSSCEVADKHVVSYLCFRKLIEAL